MYSSVLSTTLSTLLFAPRGKIILHLKRMRTLLFFRPFYSGDQNVRPAHKRLAYTFFVPKVDGPMQFLPLFNSKTAVFPACHYLSNKRLFISYLYMLKYFIILYDKNGAGFDKLLAQIVCSLNQSPCTDYVVMVIEVLR